MILLRKFDGQGIRNKNILLVIAHPDDEVMFFGPSLIGVTNAIADNTVSVLCLSNGLSQQTLLRIGNADGLGSIREKELVESVRYFGINNVEILNHPYSSLKRLIADNFKMEWIYIGLFLS
jgi:LmbE family N-acetylglucosaminyl deacetylase